MKKLLIVMFILLCVSSKTIYAREVKVMFADELTSESSIIQPYNDWYLGLDKETTTMSQMYAEGWTLIQAIKLNAVASSHQFWLIFER